MKAEALADQLLKTGSICHKYHVGLENICMAQDMSPWMNLASTACQEIYQDVMKLVKQKVNEDAAYEEVQSTAIKIFEIFDQYSPLAKNMLDRSKTSKVSSGPDPDCFAENRKGQILYLHLLFGVRLGSIWGPVGKDQAHTKLRNIRLAVLGDCF